MWYIKQNWCAFPLFDFVNQFCHAARLCIHFIRLFVFFSLMVTWLFFCFSSYSTRPLPILTSVFTTVLCISFLSAFRTRFVYHIPPFFHFWLLSQRKITIGFDHFQNVNVGELKWKEKKHARSSFRTTGFYLWHNKDAPQSDVWCILFVFFLVGHFFSFLFFCNRVGGGCQLVMSFYFTWMKVQCGLTMRYSCVMFICCSTLYNIPLNCFYFCRVM